MKPLYALIAFAVLALTSCKKDEDEGHTRYTYNVRCADCEVKWMNPVPVLQGAEVKGTWKTTIYAKPGQPVSLTAFNTEDTTNVHVEIVKDDAVLKSADDVGADANASVSVTAE